MYAVALDREVLHVAVHDERLGGPKIEVRQLVIDDLDPTDRLVGRRSEDAHPVGIPAAPALEHGPEVVHRVPHDPDVVGGSGHEDPGGHVTRRVAAIPGDVEAADRHVSLILDRDHRGPSGRCVEGGSVQDDRLPGCGRERDGSSRFARHLHADPLSVRSPRDEDRVAGSRGLSRVLDRRPRFVLAAPSGVVAVGCHPDGSARGRRRWLSRRERPGRHAEEHETRGGQDDHEPALRAHGGQIASPLASSNTWTSSIATRTWSRDPGRGRSCGGSRSRTAPRSVAASARRVASST